MQAQTVPPNHLSRNRVNSNQYMKHHQISKFFKPAKRKADSGAGILQSSKLGKFKHARLESPSEPQPKIEQIKQEEDDATEKPVPAVLHVSPEVSKPPKPTKRIPAQSVPKAKLTPLEKQILELKEGQDDKLLAIQVGYKYKFYGTDAAIVAKLINIMLIPQEDHRFNYCSIPDNRLHVHLKRLLSHGYKVGVVKQLDSSSAKAIEAGGKSLFTRKLTAVYTSATYMNEEVEEGRNLVLDDHNGEYICCIEYNDKETAVCFVRPLTGEIVVDVFEDDDLATALETRLTYFKPSECLLCHHEGGEAVEARIKKLVSVVNSRCCIEARDVGDFTAELQNSLPDISDYYTLNFSPLVVSCVNELVKYLRDFSLETIFTIPSNIVKFKNTDYMILPANVLNTLEVFENSTDHTTRGSLMWLLNHTRTKMGERMLYKWVSRPLVARDKIEDRLNSVEDLTGGYNHLVDCLKKMLTNDIDLEKSLIKLHYSVDTVKITRTEVYYMLRKFNDVLQLVKSFEADVQKIEKEFKSAELKEIFTGLLHLSSIFDVESQYLNMISSTYGSCKDLKQQKANYFNMEYHRWPEISEQVENIDQVKRDIEEETKQVSEILKTPIKLVKCLNQENLIEVRNTKVNSLPLDWIRISSTKTVTRFRSPKLQKLNNLLAYNLELLDNACDEVFRKFLVTINDRFYDFQKIISCLCKFDCLLSLAVTKAGGVKATILDQDSTIQISSFKNPIISTLTTYITNDIHISPTENRISLITGPNMGGKSSYIKSIGILVIMNQVGCYLPCEQAQMSIFTDIFIRMGSFDNIIKGQSTFMIEMLEVLHILENFNNRSLILLDEIGRGTGTTDGYLIAYSILQYLASHQLKPVVLFITHFHKLASVCGDFAHMNNFYMDFIAQDDQIVFLYKMVQGTLDNSYGLNVAKLAGVPDTVIDQARTKAAEMRRDDELRQAAKILDDIRDGRLEDALKSIE